MSKNVYPLSLFTRNECIEKNIDISSAHHSIYFESLSLFLNVLEGLIIDYNEDKDRYSESKLYDFLRLRRLRLESSDNLDAFSNEESDYINNFREYMIGIRSMLVGEKYNKGELIKYFLDSISSLVLKNQRNENYLIECIRNEVSKFPNLFCSIKENSGNIYLYIHNYKYCICLINNGLDFVLIDSRWYASLIVTRDAFSVLSKVKDSNNIDFIFYKIDDDFFRCVNIRSPLDWCLLKVDKILTQLRSDLSLPESQIFIDKLNNIRTEAKVLLSLSPVYPVKANHLHLRDIALLRRKFITASELAAEHPFGEGSIKAISAELKSIANTLSITHNRIINSLDLEKKIFFALSEIKKNNTLYIVSKGNKKVESFSFGEENLTSILASNLRCLYREYSNISINCEAMVGNGRSDVRLSMGNKTFGLIEAKLISKSANIENEIRNAIDQLYSRYSENENIEGDAELCLFLILFAYDKNFQKMAKSIKNAVRDYADRNSLRYEKIDMTENGIKFIYEESRVDFDFLDKKRTINIMVCNMEIDYKTGTKQRTINKAYNPSKIT